MSRVSIARRIDRVREHCQPRGSLRWKLKQLSEADHAEWQSWAARSHRIISRITERHGPGVAYQLIADNEIYLSPMPAHVVRALWPDRLALGSAEPWIVYNSLRDEE